MFQRRMTYRMFYKQFLKIIDILDKSFVEEFDFWLATLPERIAKTISVSTVASRFEVKYSAANAIINFAEKEGILIVAKNLKFLMIIFWLYLQK